MDLNLSPRQSPPASRLRPAFLLLLLLGAAWLAGCASSPSSPSGSLADAQPDAAGAPAEEAQTEAAAWTVTETEQAQMTGAGQQAVAVVKVPDDLDHCPFPGYFFRIPSEATSLTAWLNVSAAQGWMSMELYGPRTSLYPEGTMYVGPAAVHANLQSQTVLATDDPEPGQWIVALKPEGAFSGSFDLTLQASGTGEGGSLGLKMGC